MKKHKNAFTLIELLAVIVILAIIALIATPIILGIVEDAKKDAFVRSTELLVESTNIDVMNKITEEGYEYDVIDGKIKVKTYVETDTYEIIDKQKCYEILTENVGLVYADEEAIILCYQPEAIGTDLIEEIEKDEELRNLFIEGGAYGKVKEEVYTEVNIIKNNNKINGNIIYDKNGKVTYALYNDKYCVEKKDNANVSLKRYVEGDCKVLSGTNEMYENVQLLLGRTNQDVENKLTNYGYEYEIINGKVIENKRGTGTYKIIDDKDKCIDNFVSYMVDIGELENDDEETLLEVKLLSTMACYEQPIVDGLTMVEAAQLSPEYALIFQTLGFIEEIYEYDVVDIDNENKINGIISYDDEGNASYALHNDKICVKKNEAMSEVESIKYDEKTCTTEIKFKEFVNLNTEEGQKTISGKGQLINLGKYGIRYQGYAPNNYLYFNCQDYFYPTKDTCELWRIIGVVDGKVKIVRNESIGEYAWNDQDGDERDDVGIDISDWSNSTLKAYLNGEYYEALTSATKVSNFISPSTWYLRGHETEVAKQEMFDLERTTGTVFFEIPYIENMKIGLLYPSDFGFGAQENTSCLPTHNISEGLCNASNWLSVLGARTVENVWLLTPNGNGHVFVWNAGLWGNNVYSLDSVIPTLYLSNDVKFTGMGTKDSPYIIEQ